MFSGLSATQPSARRWTALASFLVQAVLVTSALIFPVIYPQRLPAAFFDRRIFVPLSEGEVHVENNTHGSSSSGPPVRQALVVSRSGISFQQHPMETGSGPEAPALSYGSPRGIDIGLVSITPTVLPPRPAPSQPPRTSVLMEGNLIHRVEPQYPAIAKQIHLQGTVILNAVISREGNIERVGVASGPGLLALAARDAVLQWKYRPYFLNGEPVEVETQITVNFTLEH
jgi:periplasmic protein TonB